MIDDENQRQDYGGAFPIDNVSGYTLGQLENAIDGANTFLQWRLILANQTANITELSLPQLFNNWE
ncbi:hypothetical protein [Patiriisocius marinus]|nr:hypothetical protein [Patiriisocius marinus]